MKTSVMEVHNMLSVLSVGEVEKRIGKVPGVESVTVNFAEGNATVRYDETRLDVADIKSAVRQDAYEFAPPDTALGNAGHEGHTVPGAPPTAAPPTGGAPHDKAMPGMAQSTTPSPPAAPDAEPAPTSTTQKSAPESDGAAPASDEAQGKGKS